MPEKSVLRNLMEQVAGATSLPEVYSCALTCLQETLEVERAALLAFDSERSLRFVAWSGLSDDYRAAVEGHSPWDPGDPDPAPVLVPDVRSDENVAPYRTLLHREGIRALAFVPLRFGTALLGKFMLYYREPHDFTDDEIALAEIIAAQVAYALEHFRIAGELEKRLHLEVESRKARDFLAEASRVLATTHQPGDAVRHLARIVVPRLADWCIIQVVDSQGRIVPVEVAHSDPAKVDLAWQLARRGHAPYEHGTAADAVRSGKSTLVPHIDREMLARRAVSNEHLRALQSFELTSGITVPLQTRGRILGALSVMSAESGKIYSRTDLRFIEEIASWAALAIDNAELYRQTEDARALAERARERLQTLAEVHDDLASALDPDAALRLLAKRLTGRLADYCMTYSFDGQSIRRVGSAHRDPDKAPHLQALAAADPPTLDDGWGVGPVIRSGEAFLATRITPDLIAQHLRNASHQLEALHQLDPRSVLMVPLTARGRTVGAIALVADATSSHPYDADDLELARELASHAALLVDNARLYAEARTAVQARDDMIAVVSHDLRNPLQSIASAAAILHLDPPGDRRSKSAAAIRVATSQIDRLLQDLLDITQIDAGQLFVNRERTDVASLVKETRTLFQELARERSIRLHCSVSHSLPAVYVDRGRILQVLSNLLGNALKFAPSGGRIDLSAVEHQGRVRISVADNGPGIDPEHLSKVFDRFWRADRRKERGAGLGLAVAKGIVQAHGGEIGVDSRKGEGSTFYFVLDAVAPVRAESQASLSPGPILVVDDDEPFRREIVEVLRGSGYEVVSAVDSREALEYLEGESPPSLVILDGMTPLMDGRRLYDAVRGVPKLESVPLVLSSQLNEVPVGDAAAGYLERPVRPSQLLGLAAALCHRPDNGSGRLN